MEKARPLDFESLDEPELAQMLRQFYAEVRTKSGNPYSTSGMRNIRASIQRHLTSPPYNRAINIITDRNFQVSNTIFKAQVRTLRVEGKDITKHKPVIEKEDMTKITSNLKTDNPVGLQQRVFIDLMLHFGRRGREGLRELKRESFVIKKGAGGCEYVELAYNEMEKKRDGTDVNVRETDKKMYGAGGEDCPVKNLKSYLSHLNVKCSAFFQRPSKNYLTTGKWYDNAPLGIHTLSSMMRNISEKAGLSTNFTNHSLRATTITVLSHKGISPNDICSVTGHRSTDSIRPYCLKPSAKQKRHMSDILHKYKAEKDNDDAVPSTSNSDTVAESSTSVASHTADDHLSKGSRPTSETFSRGSSTLPATPSGSNVNTLVAGSSNMPGELISAGASGNSTPTVLGGEQQNQPAVPMNMQNLWNFAQKSSSGLVTGNTFSGNVNFNFNFNRK